MGNKPVGVLNCIEDDLSVRWIWTQREQMLNLKTLKCLKREKGIERSPRKRQIITELSLEQCDSRSSEQEWRCNTQDGENKGDGVTFKWVIPRNDSYFQTCNEATDTYEGNVVYA